MEALMQVDTRFREETPEGHIYWWSPYWRDVLRDTGLVCPSTRVVVKTVDPDVSDADRIADYPNDIFDPSFIALHHHEFDVVLLPVQSTAEPEPANVPRPQWRLVDTSNQL